MPFEFSPYHNQHAGTISELLQEQGNAEAEGVRQSGDAWAGAIHNIGQQVAQIPQQIQQQKRQQLQDEALAAQTGAAKALETQRLTIDKQNTYIDQVMKQSLKADPQTGVMKFDRAVFEQNLMQGGMGHLYTELAPTLDALEKNATERSKSDRSLWAHSIIGVHKAGDTAQSLLSAVAFLEANRAISLEYKAQVQQALEQDASPANVKAITDAFGAKLPEYGDLVAAEDKRKADLAKTKADTAKTEAETKNLQQFGRATPTKPTEFEDYLSTYARDIAKKPLAQLTAKEKEDARKRWNQADDRPIVPVVIQTSTGPQLVDRGNATAKPITDASGAQVKPQDTADMRNKVVARGLVGKSISAIKDLGDSIITKIGPAQRADAIKRGAEAVFGTDPKFRTYQDARMALAGNLAVGQQGSRPSDADIKAIWLPLVPDPYRDTSESAAMKWQLIKTMSNTEESPSGDATGWTDLGGGVRVREKK